MTEICEKCDNPTYYCLCDWSEEDLKSVLKKRGFTITKIEEEIKMPKPGERFC